MATPAHLLPSNEAERLRALQTWDAAAAFAEPACQRLVEVVASAYQLPHAFISAVGAEQVDFLATYGVPDLHTLPREAALCSLAVSQQHTVVLNHLLTAPENAHQRTAQRFGLAAYVGVPILVAEQLTVGVFCISSPVPREFSQAEIEGLEELATLVSDFVSVRHHLIGRSTRRRWRQVQQPVAEALQHAQNLLFYLVKRHQIGPPTSPAVLNALRQRVTAVRVLLREASVA